MRRQAPKVPKATIAKARNLMRQRKVYMDRADLVEKLQRAGEVQRATHLRNNLHNDALRMDGELSRANNHMTARQRQEHAHRIAQLLHIAAGIAVR